MIPLMLIVVRFIVPPEHPEIYDSEGKQLQKTAGPYLEGLSVRLTCIVRGGKHSNHQIKQYIFQLDV